MFQALLASRRTIATGSVSRAAGVTRRTLLCAASIVSANATKRSTLFQKTAAHLLRVVTIRANVPATAGLMLRCLANVAPKARWVLKGIRAIRVLRAMLRRQFSNG